MEEFCSATHGALPFLSGAWQKPRYIDDNEEWNTKGIAGANKASSFFSGRGVQGRT
jgi:hypothetical protein